MIITNQLLLTFGSILFHTRSSHAVFVVLFILEIARPQTYRSYVENAQFLEFLLPWAGKCLLKMTSFQISRITLNLHSSFAHITPYRLKYYWIKILPLLTKCMNFALEFQWDCNIYSTPLNTTMVVVWVTKFLPSISSEYFKCSSTFSSSNFADLLPLTIGCREGSSFS